ncbi:hypothetical protein CLA18_20495 [Pseudomonas protegens]|nr:hypothetical protein CLA18_20495 [Pseudomonas protegens]
MAISRRTLSGLKIPASAASQCRPCRSQPAAAATQPRPGLFTTALQRRRASGDKPCPFRR